MVSRVLFGSVKRSMQGNDLYELAKDIKWAIHDHASRRDLSRVLSVAPARPVRGKALVSYGAAFEEFSREPGQPMSTAHIIYWESRHMVETLMGLGYSVDIIHQLNSTFVPKTEYSLVVDSRNNLERLAPLLPDGCTKVMHLDTAHLLFNNAAEAQRLLDLQCRRGVTLPPRRFQILNLGLEIADCGTTQGNEWTISTYKYTRKPIYRLPVPATVSLPWPENKNWDTCRRRFLWFNSGGFVHKGLDLVLEAFAAMPECHLTVCGPLQQEPDFVRVYEKELYKTSNIQTVGWIDVSGPAFAEIAASCGANILASCSEGANSSAVNCMHAALVPMLSVECGLDVGDFGFFLPDCSVESIRNMVRGFASRPPGEVRDRARATWEFANATHTRARFAQEYRPMFAKILGRQDSGNAGPVRAEYPDLAEARLQIAR